MQESIAYARNVDENDDYEFEDQDNSRLFSSIYNQF